MSKASVEIDCAPGTPRPDTYFDDMCRTCGVDPTWFEEPHKFFGNWEWVVKPGHEKAYLAKREQVKSFIKELYDSGSIRYGSW